MKFSIVIPTVPGNERLLRTSLSSLMKHRDSAADYEVIVVPNNWEGFSKPVNRGIELATGDYILIMNDDVEILEKFWERKMVLAFKEGVGIVGPLESMQHGKYSAMWFTMIKREVFDKIGLLDETMNLFSQDIDFGYHALKEGFKTEFIELPLRHATSSTTGKMERAESEKIKNEAKARFKEKWGVDHDKC